MKRWIMVVLFVLVLSIENNDTQFSGEEEDLPGLSQVTDTQET